MRIPGYTLALVYAERRQRPIIQPAIHPERAIARRDYKPPFWFLRLNYEQEIITGDIPWNDFFIDRYFAVENWAHLTKQWVWLL